MSSLRIRHEGVIPYREAWELQKRLVDQRCRGEICDTLFLCQHSPVITRGRRTAPTDIVDPRVLVVEVERGGKVTYHAPGQLVGYPIFDLSRRSRDLRRFLRDLEECLMQALHALGVEGFRRDGWTGVWTEQGKIASIGIAVRRWVSWHGFALNVDNDPADFACIRPCGLDATEMTSVATILGDGPWLSGATQAVCESFRQAFS